MEKCESIQLFYPFLQGGTGIKKKDLGRFFLLRPFQLVIRHMSKYGNYDIIFVTVDSSHHLQSPSHSTGAPGCLKKVGN